MIISRKLSWISAVEQDNYELLTKLSSKLQDFYLKDNDYYNEINFTEDVWIDPEKLEQQDILNEIKTKERILEVGCGRANILKTSAIAQEKYTGLEFSEEIIKRNMINYPKAKFINLQNPSQFPFESGLFDIVFSHFVIEHTVFPHKFLDECIRVLKKNGMLLILCPDFLGKSTIASQRTGYSNGTGREKLKKGKLFDAMVTGFDNKVKIPLYTAFLRLKAKKKPRFYINICPRLFFDDFQPDVDAVYLTYKTEIINYTKDRVAWLENEEKINHYSMVNGHIYLKGLKV